VGYNHAVRHRTLLKGERDGKTQNSRVEEKDEKGSPKIDRRKEPS